MTEFLKYTPEKSLYERLLEYGESEYYPYHMPGHKRQPLTRVLEHMAKLDITEIDGFDNLHQPQGILQRMQEHAAAVYGAEESFYLVNGSTSGVLSAICAAIPQGGKLLLARHCHKSVYHGAYIRRAEISYLFAEEDESGILGPITPEQIEKELSQRQGIGAVLIVSPTYEGIISDIEGIAEVVHRYGIPLIVDEAHGAHLGFHPGWMPNSSRLGADISIQSLHKTLPSMTQTSILHVNHNRIDRKKLRRYLSIYQTSSPSYIMMAGMEEAISLLEEKGDILYEKFLQCWKGMLQTLSGCRNLYILPKETTGPIHDAGKLVISVGNAGISGRELYEILLKKYQLQMELAAGTYVLAMFTVADTEEGYRRLTRALLEIDRELEEKGKSGKDKNIRKKRQKFPPPEKALEFWEAWDAETEDVEIEQCIGRIAGEFVMVYPPGIPLTVPGEVWETPAKELICRYLEEQLPVQGVIKKQDKWYLKVLKQDKEDRKNS